MARNGPIIIALINQNINAMEKLTLETLPKAITELSAEVNEIKKILLEKREEQSEEIDSWFDIDEFCKYHPDKPKKATVYGWVHSGLVPCHKGGKRLSFLKSEIDSWIKKGRKMTISEARQAADKYVSQKRGGTNG